MYYLLSSINRKQALTQPYACTIRRQRSYIRLIPLLWPCILKLVLRSVLPQELCATTMDHEDDDLLAISGFRGGQ
jgi:hypothetical protein